MDNLDIAFCVSEDYIKYLKVIIRSLLDNHSPNQSIHIHVINDKEIGKQHNDLTKEFDKNKNLAITFYKVEGKRIDELKSLWGGSIYVWMRLLIPELLTNDIDKVLYLDTDVVIDNDITDLFNLDMTDKAVAGVLEWQTQLDSTFERVGYDKKDKYICAGVLMMNLNYWRENDLATKMFDLFKSKKKLRFYDQDVINIICKDTKIILPLKYGMMDNMFLMDCFYTPKYIQELKEARQKPCIIHYAGSAPWHLDTTTSCFNFIWDKYNKKLKSPVKKSYKTNGFLKYKIMLWDLLRASSSRKIIDLKEIDEKLSLYN